MRYLSLVLISLSFCWAEGRWVEQDNPFNGEEFFTYTDICFVDSLHGWAYGEGRELSGVVGTKDGGKTWEKLSDVPAYSTKMSYLNNPDGGGIKFLDTLHGWWVCAGAAFTKDGGKTWKWQRVAPGIFTDVEFVDTLRGWFVTSGGHIYYSEDGGENWVVQDTAPHSLRAVCFISDKKGFAVGDFGVMMRTLDGGEHWEKVDLGITRDLYDIQFADSLHGIVVGGCVLRTVDGGETWNEISGVGGTDVAFPDTLHVWSASMCYSRDGGLTWQLDTSAPPFAYYGISFPDTLHGWACGEYGTIIHYTLGTGIKEVGNKSQVTSSKLQVTPNPAIKKVSIKYYVRDNGPVSLKIYDASGALVETLVSGKQGAGYRTVVWRNKKAGVYFCQLEIEGRNVTKKVVVLK